MHYIKGIFFETIIVVICQIVIIVCIALSCNFLKHINIIIIIIIVNFLPPFVV